MLALLILISVRDSNKIILKTWTRSSLNQLIETESDRIN
jgi:hypothetical protein